jgi:hypothetical protein
MNIQPEVFHGIIEVVDRDRFQVGGFLDEIQVIGSSVVNPDIGYF